MSDGLIFYSDNNGDKDNDDDDGKGMLITMITMTVMIMSMKMIKRWKRSIGSPPHLTWLTPGSDTNNTPQWSDHLAR